MGKGRGFHFDRPAHGGEWRNLNFMKDKIYCVYIMTNKTNSTLYIGFSGDLRARIYSHKKKLVEGFTKRYNIDKLVYYECSDDYEGVLAREKQIKKWRREKKIALIKKKNPEFRDLYDEIE